MGCSNAPSSVPAKDLVVGAKIHHNLLGAIIQNHYYCVISLMMTKHEAVPPPTGVAVTISLTSGQRHRDVTSVRSEDLVPV